jgi:hypothetical protein
VVAGSDASDVACIASLMFVVVVWEDILYKKSCAAFCVWEHKHDLVVYAQPRGYISTQKMIGFPPTIVYCVHTVVNSSIY